MLQEQRIGIDGVYTNGKALPKDDGQISFDDEEEDDGI